MPTAFTRLNHCLLWLAMAASVALAACGGGADDPPTNGSNTSQASSDTPASSRPNALAAPATSNDNTSPSGYTSCAVEGQRCNFNGAANVVYGAGSTWTSTRSYTGGVDCNNATFGDPRYGVVKACYVSASSPPPPPPPPPPSEEQPPAGYTPCAAENQRCSFSGAANVIYGARGTWTPPRSFNGGVDCGNAVFGDPLQGVVKACYVNAATPAPPPTITQTFSATSADFPNPERGFYGWSGSDFVTRYDANSVKATSDAGMRLLLALVQLDNFRSADLSADWLRALDASFAKVRAAGMKVTLAVSYDFTAGGKDATAAQIKRHLEQLKPVLAANADVIPYMRAGFIGAWGEWHSSQSGNSCGYNSPANITCEVADANRVIVRDALFANVPSTTQIGFRYPPDLQKWYPSPRQQSRAGMHNDCFLAGPTDTGTYAVPGSRAYAQALSENAAFGGETCNAGKPARDTCADILSEGAQYHVAWLNINYAPSFITAWKAGGCFNEVSRSIGYRLQLDAISHAASVARGNTLSVSVDLRNVGWARIFSDRPLVVTLKHVASGNTINAAAGNLRELSSQAIASTRVTVNVTIPASAASGDYEMALSAPDVFAAVATDARFAVRFAIADNPATGQAWEGGSGVFKTGTAVSVR
jgi:hypothetical protein